VDSRPMLVQLSSSSTRPSTTEPYTLSLHDALPIYRPCLIASTRDRLPITGPTQMSPAGRSSWRLRRRATSFPITEWASPPMSRRSEEHTSELQSRGHLVCRLLLEKKKLDCGCRSYF